MLRDAMIIAIGILIGWVTMAGCIWLWVWLDERKREKEDC